MNAEAWLILANAWVTRAEYRQLKQHFDDIESIVEQRQSRLQDSGLAEHKARAVAEPDRKLLRRGLQWLQQDGHHLIACDDGAMPELLTELNDGPLLLYVNGSANALHLPSLAMVGSRNPTDGGVRNALEFARHLARSGFSIVSGLAQGIDSAAHRGALDVGGSTVAFLGHGIDRVYPARNRELAHEIARCGALVSEYPLGAPPARHHFPERNRLISGLAVGVLVVEAARQSGTLITARLAADQGREVFALPGSIHNPLARGCHRLIRQGAKLVEQADDIMVELGALTGHLDATLATSGSKPKTPADPDADYEALRNNLSHDPISLDDLERRSGLTIEQLSSMLLILELHGEVEAMSGGRYALTG